MAFDLVFCWPGAGVRWMFYRGKRPFKQLSEDIILNSAIGAMTLALVVGGVYALVK